MLGCSIRAIWILDNQGAVIFSRRFPVVEKRWRSFCERENHADDGCSVVPLLPSDAELASAFAARKSRDGSYQGYGLRVPGVMRSSDSWIDDPLTRNIISLHINKEEDKTSFLLWPLILLAKIHCFIIVLPLVEPYHAKAYEKLCNAPYCGTSVGLDESLASILVDLPCVTGGFMVAHALGDVIGNDFLEAEIVMNSSPSMVGLLDSLTGSIGISSISTKGKTTGTPATASAASGMAVMGSSISCIQKNPKLIDRNALRLFICRSLPFGTPLDLSYSNVTATVVNGFSSSDLLPVDMKQPAWKPYLYKGKQRILFSMQETIYAAMYDRDEIPDMVSISGQISCRAELEGLPDVSIPLTGLDTAHVEALFFHHCAQVPENDVNKQALIFSPPLGSFVLMRYQALCSVGPPVTGFYQLSVVSADEGAFILKLCLMDGYKPPLNMEFCTVTLPFPQRRVIQFDGNPSVGTALMTEHSIEWKIVSGGRGITGKTIEATFVGTISFAPKQNLRVSHAMRTTQGSVLEDDSDTEPENFDNNIGLGEFLQEELNRDLPLADLEEPFCWQAYNYAKVSFKILGGSLSGLSIDPKSVTIYPAVKCSAEVSMQQASSGDYILWNTLGRCPFVALAKV